MIEGLSHFPEFLWIFKWHIAFVVVFLWIAFAVEALEPIDQDQIR